MQETFENDVSLLQKRISKITENVIKLNVQVNQRNNHLIGDVSKIIHEVLHETQMVSTDFNNLKKSVSANELAIGDEEGMFPSINQFGNK